MLPIAFAIGFYTYGEKVTEEKKDLPYLAYSTWLKAHYGQKVYKIPINTGASCPNRDGMLGYGGCIFCGAYGGSDESLSPTLSIKDQLKKNKAYIGKRYHVSAFIPFFQNYSNTYCTLKELQSNLVQCVDAVDTVGISIATRPDCVTDQQLEMLSNMQQQYKIDICLELGLQTSNYKTLRILQRHHGLGDYIDAAIRIKEKGLMLCTHTILDLPWDERTDVKETASIISAVSSDFVKCHSLYIEKGTKLAQLYQDGKIQLLELQEYIERAILFLSFLSPDIAVQRIIGRAPKKDSIVTNWNTSWWKVRDNLIDEMLKRKIWQGKGYSANKNRLIEKLS